MTRSCCSIPKTPMKLDLGETCIKINVSFAAVVTLTLILDESGLCAVALFCCIIHELGHIVCLLFMGEQPRLIELSFYGIRLERRKASDYKSFSEIIIYASGPAVNMLFSAVFFMISHAAQGMKTVALISLGVGLFNLLPCRPLDGGNIILCVLNMIFDEEKAEKLSFYITCIMLAPMTAAGIIAFLKSENITLIAVTAYLAAMCWFDKKSEI